jgi:Vacuole effluxer Atg22 like
MSTMIPSPFPLTDNADLVGSRQPAPMIVGWIGWVFPQNCRQSNGSVISSNGNAAEDSEYHSPSMGGTQRSMAIPLEAYGLAVDDYGRATIGMSSIFLGPALLQLAAIAAGCPSSASNNDNHNNEDDDIYEECTNTIYGFRPSSLLTNLAALSGVLGCIALPLIGSMVDHTPYRKQLGAWTAVALVVTKGLEFMISSHTWEVVAALQIVSALLFYSHITASYAYISELSPIPTVQASFNSTFFMILYASTLIFMIEVMVVSSIWNSTISSYFDMAKLDDVGTARVSQTMTVLTSAPCFAFAWTKLFRNRPAASRIPPGMTVVSAGYRQLYRTARKLQSHYPALTMLLCAISLSEAASGALIAVSTTYMKNVLRMNAKESTCLRYH